MKMIHLALLFLTLLATTLSGQLMLEFWEFNDPAGTDLNELANSGSLGSSWNFNTPADLTSNGQFVLGGGSGTSTRKLPDGLNEDGSTNLYASPLTTGTYTLSINFASWNIDSGSVGDSWKLGINAADGLTTLAQVIFEVDSASSTRLRLAAPTDSGGNYRNFSYGLTQPSPVSAAIEFDFDLDTVRYLVDGVETHSFTGFTATEIGQMTYIKSGTWGTAASSITIDSMGLTAVPEPATLTLICGLTALGIVSIRRRLSASKID